MAGHGGAGLNKGCRAHQGRGAPPAGGQLRHAGRRRGCVVVKKGDEGRESEPQSETQGEMQHIIVTAAGSTRRGRDRDATGTREGGEQERTMIMATSPERKSTIMKELRIENQ